MSRIDEIFAAAKKEHRLAFMPYITAGYPSLPATSDLIKTLSNAGSDIIEIGIPFSDPLADGPTIQMSSQKALNGGATIHGVMDLVAEIRSETDCALVAMTYVNPVHTIGYAQFAESLKKAGFDGIIVPDLPPEEGAEFFGLCKKIGVDTILLAAPTSSPERIRSVASQCSGFLYCVSVAGVTGARRNLSGTIRPFLETAKSVSPVPLALGFGISTPEHVREAADLVDGVIVGSAIIEVISRHAASGDKAAVAAVESFVAPFVEAARHPSRKPITKTAAGRSSRRRPKSRPA